MDLCIHHTTVYKWIIRIIVWYIVTYAYSPAFRVSCLFARYVEYLPADG